MSRIERLIKNWFSPNRFIDEAPAIQRELDAENYRESRSNPWRQLHKGVYAPRTLQEAGL